MLDLLENEPIHWFNNEVAKQVPLSIMKKKNENISPS